MFTITGIRHAWPEQTGFRLYRPYGHPDYSFVHFISNVEIYLNNESIMAPKHTCIIYSPGTPQQFCSHQPLLHDWFHFSGNPEILLEKLKLPLNTLLYPKQHNFITGIVQEAEHNFLSKKLGYEELISSKITELFINLARTLSDETGTSIDNSVQANLRNLRNEILQSPNHSWTVAEMASRISLSESHFSNVYRSFYGTSPVDDLIRARIDAAQNALLFTEQPIYEIAESLGYNNVTHFIRQFHNFTGTSPAKYRKNGAYNKHTF